MYVRTTNSNLQKQPTKQNTTPTMMMTTTTIRPFATFSRRSLMQPKLRCNPLLLYEQHRNSSERFPKQYEHGAAGRRSAATLARSLSRSQYEVSLSSYQQQIKNRRQNIALLSCSSKYSMLASSHKLFSTEASASAKSSKGKGSIPSNKVSLALSVYFKQPELGMKDYEILSRATAFLLAVDPPSASSEARNEENNAADGTNNSSEGSPYSSHLRENERRRQEKLYKQTHRYTPASGRRMDGDYTTNPGQKQQQRPLQDLSWLEFAPREVRPVVHVVCSSHVLSPFLWRQYYPQDWLNKVRQEHWYVVKRNVT